MGRWTVGRVRWPRPGGSWFTVALGGEVHGPGSNSLVLQDFGGVNTGADPGTRIALDADEHYVFVAEGITLHPTDGSDISRGTVGWTSNGTTPAGTITVYLTIYDSSFGVLHQDSGTNIGDLGPGSSYEDAAVALLSTDFTMPEDGYVAVRLDNTSSRTLTILTGTSLMLVWS